MQLIKTMICIFYTNLQNFQGVESEKCPSFSKAMEHGEPVKVKIEPTLADGLAVPMVGYNAFQTATPLIDKMVVVKEEWIALAILRLVEQEKSNFIELKTISLDN